MKPTIVFVVGHSNWGKSNTLRALTEGSSRVRSITVSGVTFKIRRMSNDDASNKWVRFIEALDPKRDPFAIVAMCPVFHDSDRTVTSQLRALRRKGYSLHFWVQLQSYKDKRTICAAETAEMEALGEVEIVDQCLEGPERSALLKEYLSRVVQIDAKGK